MVGKGDSVGARRVVGTLLGEPRAVRWSRLVLRFWGFIFVAFVVVFVWIPAITVPAGRQVGWWIAAYVIYLVILEALSRLAKQAYESPQFRMARIQFNLVMICVLIWLAPPTASSYLWFFLTLPVLATLLYFGRFLPLLLVYLEVLAITLTLILAHGQATVSSLGKVIAQDTILGLLAGVFYFFIRFFPWLREGRSLSQIASTLIQVLDQRGVCQLLADAAKAGVATADAAVVHILGGEDNQTLIARGSSNVDLTTLGKSPMKIGVGVAGHAVETGKAISVPDVDKDERYVECHPTCLSFRSLMAAPMYVGDEKVGSISIQSAKERAFGDEDMRFLTTLAAQGAIAIANVSKADTSARRKQQLSAILEASRTFGLDQPLSELLDSIASEVCRCCGYRIAVVNLLDENDRVVPRALAGVPSEYERKLRGTSIPHEVFKTLLRDEFRTSRSYLIRHDRRPEIQGLDGSFYVPDLGERKPSEWQPEDLLIVPIQTKEEELLGYITVNDPVDRKLPSFDTTQALEILVSVAATAIQNIHLVEALEREHDLLQTLMENVPDLIYFKDAESKYVASNEAYLRFLGVERVEEIVGKTDFEFFPSEYARRFYEEEQEIIRSGRPVIAREGRIPNHSGDMAWVSETEVPIDNNETIRLVGISRDISKRKRAEEQLAQQNRLFQTFMDNVPDNIYFKDKESRFIDVNKNFAVYFGFDGPERARGKTDFDIFTPEHAQQAYDDEQDIMRTDTPVSKEEKETWPDGRVTWVVTSKMPLHDEKGNIVGTFGSSKDITQRKLAEQALQRRSEELALLNTAGQMLSSTLKSKQVLEIILEQVRLLLNVVAASVWLIDPETGDLVCHHAITPRGECVRGYRLKAGQGIAGWVAARGQSQIVADVRNDDRHFKGVDRQTGMELRSILAVPLRVKTGIIGVLEVLDVEPNRFNETDLTLIEALTATAATAIQNAQLYEETDKLKAFNENIVQKVNECIMISDDQIRIMFVNPMTVELLGCASEEELIGQPSISIIAPEERQRVEQEIAKRREGVPSRYNTVLLTKDERRVPVIVSATPLFDDDSAFIGVLCVFTDITDIRREETRLQDYLSTVTTRLAQQFSLDVLYQVIVQVGTSFLSARDCSLFLVDDDGAGTLEMVATTAPESTADCPIVIAKTSGSGLISHVASTCQSIRLMGKQISQHPSWSKEIWAELGWGSDKKNGHSILAVPMCTADGSVKGVLLARDTNSKRGFSASDERLLGTLATNAVAEIERFRTIDEVRAEAVRTERKRLEYELHEAMNILATGVRWDTEILADEIGRGDLEAATETLRRIQAARTRAYTDLRYLLQDLRDPTLEKEGVLTALKRRAELVRSRYIKVHVDGSVLSRLPRQVESVLYRVGQEAMDNAAKHSAIEGQDLEIRVKLEESDGKVKLCVKDNGIGFDVESVLALSYKWGLRRLQDDVKEVGGKLQIVSKPRQGTAIHATVRLPEEAE
jgi:PAS domain S-box-containing protein